MLQIWYTNSGNGKNIQKRNENNIKEKVIEAYDHTKTNNTRDRS